MDLLSSLWAYLPPFLIVLTALVFVHELGHYWVAQRAGVKVEVFSIGFGRELVGWTDRSGTRWKIGWLPLGGYVRMYGDADEASATAKDPSKMSPEELGQSFHHKPLRWRAAIVAAGPMANFLFAILVFAVLFLVHGRPYTPPVVGSVVEAMPAERAGIQSGDRIVAINGSAIDRFEEIQRVVLLNLDRPLVVDVMRAGRAVAVTMTPVIVEETDRLGNRTRLARLGIRSSGEREVEHIRAPWTAVGHAIEETWSQAWGSLIAIGQMIIGRRTTEDLGGPLRIAKVSGEAAQASWAALIALGATLSISLGLINLFPIPMLDGGHLVFYAFEAIRGRPLGVQAQEYGFRIGLVLVLSLMLFATWQDLVHLRVVQYLVSLVS
jgi:regulator of sigma E protease